ncbi:hypothetical protein GGQ64_001931 [Rhizobium azooxidifex]|uniref:Uncharacterized protein n=1 Tax=Mycoplana azooxidifex TaxID=1636188 RepID=A0A7W6D4R6_9HYPH|nr:hypothetical protein [Mycoplana azooxidifex]
MDEGDLASGEFGAGEAGRGLAVDMDLAVRGVGDGEAHAGGVVVGVGEVEVGGGDPVAAAFLHRRRQVARERRRDGDARHDDIVDDEGDIGRAVRLDDAKRVDRLPEFALQRYRRVDEVRDREVLVANLHPVGITDHADGVGEDIVLGFSHAVVVDLEALEPELLAIGRGKLRCSDRPQGAEHTQAVVARIHEDGFFRVADDVEKLGVGRADIAVLVQQSDRPVSDRPLAAAQARGIVAIIVAR